MVEFVKWLKSLHFSVGGSGSDSNTVEQRAKEVISKFSTHAFVSLGLMALKQHYVTILPWNIIFKNILCYNVLVQATSLPHRLFLGYATSDLQCINIYGSVLDTAPTITDFI